MVVVNSGSATRSIPATPILLVEDDPGDAVLVQACLGEVGVPDDAIIWTRTLADALEALARKPRCVLLDLGLPDTDGFGSVHKMVEAAPTLPVIVLTGRQERDGVDALAAGAQDYLVKDSLSGELLERSIRYAIERKRAQRTQEQLREARLSASEQGRLERGLLPTPLLRSQAVECSTYYQPGRDHAVLGGDFFDVVETHDGLVRAVIGDVMGHGPDEAALGVHLRVAWRTLVLAGTPDQQILPTLARLLEAEQDEQRPYVTACDVTIGPQGAIVRLAGHPAPIIGVDGACSYPELVVGAPLGVRLPPDIPIGWPDNVLALPPSASMLLYTDGLLDAYAVDADSDSLGIVELVNAVQTCMGAGAPAPTWISRLVHSAPRAPLDDTAVVVLTVEPQ
ncbi:MAG TPA: SpoIIE family protein phosphatase [Jatrophihabitans sp.]|nr:SpoIIE family protein phosphatase [Jatrophihabitans sp.]